MLIIPRAEAPALLAKHSAKLLEDGRMSQAARLAAQQERILKDPLLADDEAVQRVKPVSRRLRRAVKKIRQLDTQPLTVGEQAAQDQELVTPAFTKWMQRMVRQQKPTDPPKIKTELRPISKVTPWGVSAPLKRRAPAEPAPKKRKRKQEVPKQLETRSSKKAGPPIVKPKEPPPPTGTSRRKQKKPKRLRRPRLSEETKEKVSGAVGKALKKSLSRSWKKW